MNTDKFIGIIRDLISIRKETGLNADDNNLLDIASRIYNSEYIGGDVKPQYNKDIPMKNPNDPATDKQKKFLEANDYQGDVNILTKAEASALIDKFKKEKIREYEY